ncbi:DUF2663 family protein [Anaerobacillus sp. MEB173]|uniref:DUF2663 family protein n=1 Tax=Anaerobacillus sp. MEB173 TaxID=3383345 RepID=UPI003F90FB14
MDSLTKLKGNILPKVAEVSLKELVKLKEKEEKYEKRKIRWSYTTIAFVVAALLYSFYVKMYGTGYLSGSPIQFFINDFWMKVFAISIAGSFFQVHMMDRKYEKAEKEFEELRTEIIERSSELWSDPEQWNNRHIVYEVFKETYDINLYHR